MMETNLKSLMDRWSAELQGQRAKTQMTLGKLIATLEAMPENAEVANLRRAHSYRGYYCDLAFERDEGTRPATHLLDECRAAMGRLFHGYKGGDFQMGEWTPVWIAEYGRSGLKLISLDAEGNVETAVDD